MSSARSRPQIGEVKGSAARLEKAAPPAVGLIMTGLTVFMGGGYYGQILKEYRKSIVSKGQRGAESNNPR
jgi:hypothetical protein